MLCCRQNNTQFSTKSFHNIVNDYFSHDKDFQLLVMEIKESMPITGLFDKTNANQQNSRQVLNPKDNSKILHVSWTLLQQNSELLLLTAVTDGPKKEGDKIC